MATPNEKLAASLDVLKKIQEAGLQAIPGKRLTRTHRERLLNAGFLVEILQGWYIPSRSEEQPGSSTAWFAHIRDFVTGYCNHRFGEAWHLNPELSLELKRRSRSAP